MLRTGVGAFGTPPRAVHALLCLCALATPLACHSAAAPRTSAAATSAPDSATLASLDSLAHRFLLAELADDGAAIARLVTADQPRLVMYMFTATGVRGKDSPTPLDPPAPCVSADTAWRAYQVVSVESPIPFSLVFRFERDSSEWKIAQIVPLVRLREKPSAR